MLQEKMDILQEALSGAQPCRAGHSCLPLLLAV